MITTLLDLLFPVHCAACDARCPEDGAPASRLLCGICQTALDPPLPFDCPRCGQGREPGAPCLACRIARPPFERLRSAYLYGGPLMEAILACKYRPLAEAVPGLCALFADALCHDRPEVDRVVAVPTHPRHFRRRGFGLAEALAFEAGIVLSRPTLPGVVRRRGKATTQAGATLALRRANVRGAFGADLLSGLVRGARVLLVDDVYTTGATARAASRVLIGAGASRVEVAVLARTEREL